ncbi:membrane protein implicated in regulation of membrane protease activity [Pseudomonas sp. SORGH_AS199]|jgi:membrane protein implicated in regulation of membrane protease activity|uniref:Uncharacterized protein n=2 Tax=Pseudomonas TaxID=286 RepID=A0A2Z5ADH2_9PSED|nr:MULTISPECIES: NfeD family protein [Pseudomonas]AXA68707.1 hypothetical protein CE139_23855 [Pseudomonas oryzihabitans]MDH4765488.1 NfeD family protein [Pseudomonas sp. CBMAI 2609]MDK8266161.1 NfeD family protein [Pseudomonas oryzihabitans]MDR6228721.1 membrane protein implicated in regulation of membrane protease activity [Pseudomonas sp. SORGH_AS_0199]QNQ98010.1 hypothetical protein BGI51_10110 [Pseudomonas psychrotolerans]
MDVQWWYWLVLGVGLMLSELVVPAFFLIWFGLGALLVGVLLLVLPALALAVQLLVWSLASLVAVFLWFRYGKDRGKPGEDWSADVHLGEIGLLVAAVGPFARGRVRFQKPILGSDEWPCLADAEIAAGERVRLLAFEGNLVKVARQS